MIVFHTRYPFRFLESVMTQTSLSRVQEIHLADVCAQDRIAKAAGEKQQLKRASDGPSSRDEVQY